MGKRHIKDIKSATQYLRNQKRILDFKQMVSVAMDFPRRRLVVAPAQDASVLEAVAAAAEKDLIDYTLVGHDREIRQPHVLDLRAEHFPERHTEGCREQPALIVRQFE